MNSLKSLVKVKLSRKVANKLEKIRQRHRKSSHRINLVFIEKWSAKSEEKKTLYIRYKFGSSTAKYRSTGFLVAMSDWDKKTQTLKNKGQHIKLSKWIGDFKKKQEDVLVDLTTGTIDLDTAFAILIGKSTRGSLLDTLEDNGKLNKKSSDSIKKAYDYISAVQTGLVNLGYKKYTTLDFEHLSNHSDRKTIENAIIDEFDVKNNTKNSYLKYLGYAWKWNAETTGEIFTERLKADEYIPKQPVNKQKFTEGIINIGNNAQWFEAYLFWLLSFCLRGINGADICIMNKDWITDEFGTKTSDLKHYLPDMHKLIDTGGKTFSKKLYLTGARTKTNVRIKILLNQFPTLLVLNLLKRMVKHNRPSLAYHGKDPIKIYNIDYFTERGKKDWKNVLGTYSDQFSKMNGYTISTARNTFTDILKNHLNIEGDMLSVSLGHRPTKATHNKYANVSQERLDIIHTEVLKIFNVNDVIKLMYSIHKNKKLHGITDLNTGNEYASFSWFNVLNDKDFEALNLPLSNWDWQKEDELQKLLRQQEMSSTPVYNEGTGKLEYVNDASKYPKRLKELIKEKEDILRDRYSEFNKKVRINYNRETKAVEIIDENNNKVIKLDNSKEEMSNSKAV